jgi:polyhydroxyalkanoate synthesis repressor PhaR
MAVLIKRYANRKLYNTQTSRYITLKGIAELMEADQEVRVIDNESGDDITSVALSQILVDSERSNSAVPNSLFSQLMERGGDVIVEALQKGVHDATEGIEEFQQRVRQVVRPPNDASGIGNWIAYANPDFDKMVQRAVERVFKVLDLPRRSDIAALNTNLERVASAIENLEQSLGASAHSQDAASQSDSKASADEELQPQTDSRASNP